MFKKKLTNFDFSNVTEKTLAQFVNKLYNDYIMFPHTYVYTPTEKNIINSFGEREIKTYLYDYYGKFIIVPIKDKNLGYSEEYIKNIKQLYYDELFGKHLYHQTDVLNLASILKHGLNRNYNYFSLEYDPVSFLDNNSEDVCTIFMKFSNDFKIYPDPESIEFNDIDVSSINEWKIKGINLDVLWSIFESVAPGINWLVIDGKIHPSNLYKYEEIN